MSDESYEKPAASADRDDWQCYNPTMDSASKACYFSRWVWFGVTLLALVHSACRSSGQSGLTKTTPAYVAAPGVATLDALSARTARLLARVEATAPDRPPSRSPSRQGRAPCPSLSVTRVLAMPSAECTAEPAGTDADIRSAMYTVVRALVRDLQPLIARLRHLGDYRHYGGDQWQSMTEDLLRETIAEVAWIAESLESSHAFAESADPTRAESMYWRMSARTYEAALLGAQVIAVWTSWFDFARVVHARTSLNAEWILVNLAAPWTDMRAVLAQLRTLNPGQLRAAAQTLQTQLPVWTDGLRDFGERAQEHLGRGAALTRKLLIVQAVFDLLITHKLVGSAMSGSRAGYTFTMPGIGGVTASGAATGVRVAISAEWVKAMQHLVAIGAITTFEVAQLARLSPPAAAPRPTAPSVMRRAEDGNTAHAPAKGRRVTVLTRHRGGNRQVEAGGQRWHLPRGKKANDIPAADPVGDRLQAAVDRFKRKWNPNVLSQKERRAINKAYAASEPWRARLLERQARGRWVERKMEREFSALRWRRKGVDAVDPSTGLQYEVLSGTKYNLDLHAKRMAGEMFRMITF